MLDKLEIANSTLSISIGTANTDFNVSYESNGGTPSTVGYIDTKDVIRLSFNAPYDTGENEDFTIRLFPGVGNAQPIALVTPASMLNYYTVLK